PAFAGMTNLDDARAAERTGWDRHFERAGARMDRMQACRKALFFSPSRPGEGSGLSRPSTLYRRNERKGYSGKKRHKSKAITYPRVDKTTHTDNLLKKAGVSPVSR